MTLDAYLDAHKDKSLTEMSILFGISKGRLSQLRNSTDWPPELAMTAEEKTGGVLDASFLCPIIAKARESQAA